MEQIERIQQMEAHFDIAKDAIGQLMEALGKYEKAQLSIKALSDYYDHGGWIEDFEADEAGVLPKGLKRGVLSEDGLWNVLADDKELRRQFQQFTK